MVKRISGEETKVRCSVGHILDKGLVNAREEQVLTIPEDGEFKMVIPVANCSVFN